MKSFILKVVLLLNSTLLYSIDFITLGTGEVNGTYYPRGLYICNLINRSQKQSNMRCSVESTHGSIYNINAIEEGKFNFGISQSDTVYNAINGKEKFLNNEKEKIRSVISIYPELLTFIVSKKSKIKKLEDIKGKRINIGTPFSGSRATTLRLFKQYNIKESDLLLSGALKTEDTVDAFKDGRIDGYFFVVGHPTLNIKEAIDSIPSSLIEIKGNNLDHFLQKNPFFSKSYIPANLYEGISTPIKTFGVKAVIISSTDVKDDLVYRFVKLILENFEEFKKSDIIYKNITKESLLEGLGAPQHEGAKKYFKEINLL